MSTQTIPLEGLPSRSLRTQSLALRAALDYRDTREPFIARLTSDTDRPSSGRACEALLLDQSPPPGIFEKFVGFAAVLVKGVAPPDSGLIVLPPELHYLQDEDVVRINPHQGQVHVLYRRSSPNNSLLVTERCNSKCLMCSQPPHQVADGFIADELLQAIPLISPETEAIGFTGGEITLLKEQFIALLESTKQHLPETHLQVLTNGRMFSYLQYARRVAEVKHASLRLCVPLYSDADSIHDFVVQAKGAFDQTLRGLMNLGRVGVSLEVRVVIHRQTFERLPRLAEFIARNLPFVSHVALMGLEMTGFTRANLDALWIDPVEYRDQLGEAVEILDAADIHTSIYNHQLCLLPESLWPFARQSISDWKNIYLPQCRQCEAQEQCGGFFASATHRYSDHIRPITMLPNGRTQESY